VNQQRQVVEAIAHFGKRYNIGPGGRLQGGAGGSHLPSPPATASRSSVTATRTASSSRTVLYATKIGYNITIVVEKLFELEKIIRLAKKSGIVPKLWYQGEALIQGDR